MNHSYQGGFRGALTYEIEFFDCHGEPINALRRQYLTREDCLDVVAKWHEDWRLLKGGAVVVFPTDQLPFSIGIGVNREQEEEGTRPTTPGGRARRAQERSAGEASG